MKRSLLRFNNTNLINLIHHNRLTYHRPAYMHHASSPTWTQPTHPVPCSTIGRSITQSFFSRSMFSAASLAPRCPMSSDKTKCSGIRFTSGCCRPLSLFVPATHLLLKGEQDGDDDDDDDAKSLRRRSRISSRHRGRNRERERTAGGGPAKRRDTLFSPACVSQRG